MITKNSCNQEQYTLPLAVFLPWETGHSMGDIYSFVQWTVDIRTLTIPTSTQTGQAGSNDYGMTLVHNPLSPAHTEHVSRRSTYRNQTPPGALTRVLSKKALLLGSQQQRLSLFSSVISPHFGANHVSYDVDGYYVRR